MSTTTSEDSVHLTRHLKAPRDRVFSYFSSADGLLQWMGPGDVKVLECLADFRVGGAYSVRMTSPQFGEMTASGVYREIVEPEKIVYTWKWEDDEDWAKVESVVSIELTAIGEETELRLSHAGFPSPESRGNHEHGWGACLGKLEALLVG